LLLLALQAGACEPALEGEGVHKAEGRDYVVAWRPEPPTLQLGEFFALEVATCSKSGAALPTQLRLDAVMPEHKHGMNYQAMVTSRGKGRFRAEGLLLHMPGLWEFSFELRGSGGDEVLRERTSLR
jgi:hypothetical protein